MTYFNRLPLFLLIVLFCLPATAQKTATKKPKHDLYGDALPEGAIARLGTVRFRHHDWTWSVTFSPDGKTLLSGSSWFIKLWDTSTGKPKGELPGSGSQLLFSSDGKQLVTFGNKNSKSRIRIIRLWDFETRKILWEVDSENSSPEMGPNVTHLAFHPDGKRIIAHISNGSIFLLDRKTGRIEEYSSTDKPFLGGDSIFALSANGKQAAIGGQNMVQLLKIPKPGQPFDKEYDKEILQELKGKVTALKYLTEELLLAAIHDHDVIKKNEKGTFERIKNDITIEIWNVRTRKRVGILSPSKDREAVAAMVLSADGKTLYVSHQRWIDTWDLEKRKRTAELPQLPHLDRGMTNANLLALSKDEKLLASAGSSRMIQLWKLPERKSRLAENVGHHDIVKSITWTPDGRYLVSGSHDGTVRVWNPSTGKEVKRFVYWNKGSQLNDIAISRDGRTLAAVGTASWKKPIDLWGSVMIWNIESGKLILDVRHARLSNGVALSSDGKLVAFDSPNPFARPRKNTVFVYETSNGKKLHQFDTEGKNTHGLGFSQDSKILIAPSDQAGIFRWNLQSGKELKRIIGQAYVSAAVFALKSDLVALYGRGSNIPAIIIHDFVTGTEKQFPITFQPGQDFPYQYFYTSLSQFGGLVALKQGEFGTFGNGVIVVDTLTGKTIFSTGPIDLVTDVSLSPDGSKLATSFHNGTILIWEVYRKSSQRKNEKASSDLQKDWELTSTSSIPQVWEAIDRLTAQPHETVKLFSRKLFHKKDEIPGDVNKLLVDLDNGKFRKRRLAFAKLKSYGHIILNELQQAVKSSKSTEAKNRCRQLIDAAQIQILRDVQILEMIGDKHSQELLKRIAKGNAEEKMTKEAKRILANMKLRQ